MTSRGSIIDRSALDLDTVGQAYDSRQARLCRAIPSTFLLLALFILVLSNNARVLGDPDSIWHVAVGRWIWEHRQVPATDFYSYTFQGAPWIAKEWLSQLIFFGVHEVAGWWGIVAMTAMSIGLTFAILQEWLLQRLLPSVAIAATLIAVVLCSVHFVARPHILVLPILVVWMVAMVSALENQKAPPMPVALLMVLWANMHGSFPLGVAMAGILAGEGVLLQPGGRRCAALGAWAAFLAATGAATMITPYGWHAIMVPLKMSHADAPMRYIEEWQPLTLDVRGCLAVCILGLVSLLMARDLKTEAFRILAVGLVGVMMVHHVRFISLFGIISAILAARVLASRVGVGLKARWQPPAFLVGLLVPSVLTVLVYAATMRPAPDARVSPDAAFKFAMAHHVSGPVYNEYNFGGYLIGAGEKTFIDGRTDQLFLGDFLPTLQTALDDPEDDAFAAILTRYKIGWALVRTGSRDAKHLSRMDGWALLYRDDVALVFVPRRTALTSLPGVAQSGLSLSGDASARPRVTKP